jgi:hypothetical protein
VDFAQLSNAPNSRYSVVRFFGSVSLRFFGGGGPSRSVGVSSLDRDGDSASDGSVENGDGRLHCSGKGEGVLPSSDSGEEGVEGQVSLCLEERGELMSWLFMMEG